MTTASTLTDKQQKYAEYRICRYPPTTAARLAGYADNGGSGIRVLAHRLERHRGVQEAVRAMSDAICWEALKAIRKGQPVHDDAYDLLLEWPGISPNTRERLRQRRESNRRREAVDEAWKVLDQIFPAEGD